MSTSMFNASDVKSNFINTFNKPALLLINKEGTKDNLKDATPSVNIRKALNIEKSPNSTVNSQRDKDSSNPSFSLRKTIDKVSHNEIRKTIFLLERNSDKDYGQLLIEELQKPVGQRNRKHQQKKENEKDEWASLILLLYLFF